MLLPGALETAERVLELPTRLGTPVHTRGLADVIANPVYAAGVGLVMYGMMHHGRGPFGIRDDGFMAKVRHRMSYWLDEFF